MSMDIKDHTDAIVRMCELQERVAQHIGYDHSADCFCGKGGFWRSEYFDGTAKNGYRNDGKHIEFIEAAVQEKIQRESAGAG